MNLVIDKGNTLAKVALFSFEEEPSFQFTFKDFSVDDFSCLVSDYQIKSVIISSVAEGMDYLVSQSTDNALDVLLLTHKTKLPIRLLYDTPETLGMDRIAAVVGAMSYAEGRNLLIIDLGTAITYDLLIDGINFEGGNIAPGMEMRFAALHEKTSRLPLVSRQGKLQLVGKTTKQAIHSGVVGGIVCEIEGYVQRLKEKYSMPFVILTGGDAAAIAPHLTFPNHVDENLVLKGLNKILEYNKQGR